MFKFRVLSGLAVVLILSFVAGQSCADENEVPETRPIVEVKVDDVQYRVPVYEDLEFTQTRKDFDQKAIKAIIDKIRQVFDKIIKGGGYVTVGKTAYGILPIFKGISKELVELKKHDTSPELKDGYAANVSKLLGRVVSADKGLTTNMEKDAVKERIHRLLTAVEDFSKASPTGLYVDWTKLTIGEEREPLVSHVAPVIRYLRKHGYSMALSVLGMLGPIIERSALKSG